MAFGQTCLPGADSAFHRKFPVAVDAQEDFRRAGLFFQGDGKGGFFVFGIVRDELDPARAGCDLCFGPLNLDFQKFRVRLIVRKDVAVIGRQGREPDGQVVSDIHAPDEFDLLPRKRRSPKRQGRQKNAKAGKMEQSLRTFMTIVLLMLLLHCQTAKTIVNIAGNRYSSLLRSESVQYVYGNENFF